MRARLAPLLSALLLASFVFSAVPAVRAQVTAAAATPSAPARTAPAETLSLAGVPNAGRVNEFLYRGAQPRPVGYDELKRLGIGIVVDLHNRAEGKQQERLAVESRGMLYVSMPASSRHGPTSAQIAEFLHLLRENPRQKVFVHCHLGADRTGVMIAAFRMANEQWTPEQAMAEMRRFHFHRLWLPAMSETIRNFPKDFQSNPVFASLRTGPAAR